jgi:hypothetical protein
MMENKCLRFALAALYCLHHSAGATADIGIFKYESGDESYLYTQKKLGPSDQIYFQYVDPDGKLICCAQRQFRDAQPLHADRIAVDFRSDKVLYRYRLTVPQVSLSSAPYAGVAIVGANLKVKQGSHEGSLATEAIEFTSCFSTEGLHVLSRKGTLLISHLYLHLGYDIDSPTCRDRDLQ